MNAPGFAVSLPARYLGSFGNFQLEQAGRGALVVADIAVGDSAGVAGGLHHLLLERDVAGEVDPDNHVAEVVADVLIFGNEIELRRLYSADRLHALEGYVPRRLQVLARRAEARREH